MANRWKIAKSLEIEVRDRDKVCVYCAKPFTIYNLCKSSAPSWEHIQNDAAVITIENIALCCIGCNASKGQKPLSVCLKSKACERRGITQQTIAPVVKQAISDGL